MKRHLLVFILFCFLGQLTEAQLWKMRRYELSGGFGPTFFFGDVGGYSLGENLLGLKDITFLHTRINADISIKYRISQDFSARLSLSGGLLKATDERGSNEGRGFEASTKYFTPTLIGEYYFIKNRTENSYKFASSGRKFLSSLLNSLDVYAFTGIGGMTYNVSGNDALENHAAFKSGGFTAVIPVGVGSNMVYSPNFNFGVELGGRYAFSDYLDGYTSQYSSRNDVYFYLNFVVTYKLKTGKNGLPSFRR